MRSGRRLAAIAIAAGMVVACAGVLGLRRAAAPRFPHRAHVVEGVGCPTCHLGIEAAGDDGPLHRPSQATCRSCHPTPHDQRDCLTCHADPVAAAAAVDAKAHLRFAHQPHLSGPARGNCARCHQAIAEGDGPLRPAMAACWGCHEHDRARDLRTCDGCHVDLAEEGTLPASHLAHQPDFATRHGAAASSAADACASCHQEKFCAGCHGVTAPLVPARRTVADPLAPSVHRAGFAARHAEEASAAPGACSACHTPDRCADCHRDRGVAGASARSPHPRGWVGLTAAENQHGRAARVDPASCASCHGGAGEALCVDCHRVGGIGGSPHPPGWRSELPRTALPCRLCHQGLAR